MSKYIITKDSRLERPNWVSQEDYVKAEYGTVYNKELIDNPYKTYHFDNHNSNLFKSLKNVINYYSAVDPLFNYDELSGSIALLCINSLHLGSGISKGTVQLDMYVSGSRIGQCSDLKENGVLYSGSIKIGIVLYNEGIIILNNNTGLYDGTVAYTGSSDYPKWTNFNKTTSNIDIIDDLSYGIKNSVSVNTNFVFAEKNKLNHSNNETYIESGSYSYSYGDNFFKENEEINIKKINKSPFISGSATQEKETYINQIGLYDENKKLMAVASLANPVRKTENREFLFKIKIDI